MTTAYGTERETKIKICGLRRLEDAQIVNAVQAQYGGFVFAKSKRQVTMAQAQQFGRCYCLLFRQWVFLWMLHQRR